MPLKLIFSFLLLFGLFCLKTEGRSVPLLTSPVVDEGDLLSGKETRLLGQAIADYKAAGGPQVQMLIIKSLEGDILESFSIKATDSWKLGNEKKDDGVLFLMAIKERQMRLEVGQGLEGQLTDIKSAHIVRDVAKYFRQGNFAQGLLFVMESIAVATETEDLWHRSLKENNLKKHSSFSSGRGNRLSLIEAIFMLIAIVFVILSSLMRGHTRSSIFSGGGRYYGGGGGGFGGGGGSSWGGGGGGFSGGGSSGDW